MWQNLIVFAVLALAGGFTFWRFYEKFTGKRSCCGGGCTCKGSCGETKSRSGDAARLTPLTGQGCGCSH